MGRAGAKLIRAAQEVRAQLQAEAFVRDILVNVFKQETTDEQVQDVARKLVRLIPTPPPPRT